MADPIDARLDELERQNDARSKTLWGDARWLLAHVRACRAALTSCVEAMRLLSPAVFLLPERDHAPIVKAKTDAESALAGREVDRG